MINFKFAIASILATAGILVPVIAGGIFLLSLAGGQLTDCKGQFVEPVKSCQVGRE